MVSYSGPYMLVDEDGSKTGRLTMVDCGINGAVTDSTLIHPFNTRWIYLDTFVHGKRVEGLRECDGGHKYQNQS